MSKTNSCYLSFLQVLNTNHTLYDAVKKAEHEAHLLTREAHMAAHYLRVDFERAGIHLSAGTFCLEFTMLLLVDASVFRN